MPSRWCFGKTCPGGKSTLGHALAKELSYYEIDVEDYYFPEQKESRRAALDGEYGDSLDYLGDMPYSVSRTKEEVEEGIAKDIAAHPRYILTGVTINWSEEILSNNSARKPMTFRSWDEWRH